jgi:membrane-associated phospholipid phosphatase
MAHCPNAAVYFTTSNGESDSPGNPPIVPLMPDILFISAKVNFFCGNEVTKKMTSSVYFCTMIHLQSPGISWLDQLLNWDYQLMFLVNREMVHPWLDNIALMIREPVCHVPLYVFIILMSFQYLGKKAWIWLLGGIALIGFCDFISSHLIKDFFDRPRPCRDPFMATHFRLIARYCGANGSFTSSHAFNHFAFATYVFLTLRRFSGKYALLFVWAASIACAQVYVGVHYPSDILGGGLLGIVFGIVGARLAQQALSLRHSII